MSRTAPIDPSGETHYLAEAMRRSALMPDAPMEGFDPLTGKARIRHWRIYYTAAEWQLLLREVNSLLAARAELDNTIFWPVEDSLKSILVGKNCIAINSGTDDQREVDTLNALDAGRMDFQARRARLLAKRFE